MRELKKKSAQTGIMTLIGLVAVSCGGGGGTSSPAISTSPPPPPAQSNNTFPATGGLCDGTAGWQAIADDNLDDSAAIQTSLQEVASKGDTLTIPPGTYNIDDPEGISVVIKNQDFSIVAIGATTVGSPVASTTDGLSIRGATGGTNPRAKVDAVSIKELTVIGAPISEAARVTYLENPDAASAIDSESDSWRNAGGDSGVFIVGAQSAISNNTLNGVQRAIQVESSRNVTVSDNLIRNLGARVARQNNPVRYDRYEGLFPILTQRLNNNRMSTSPTGYLENTSVRPKENSFPTTYLNPTKNVSFSFGCRFRSFS